ncbi:MAG TPA: glycosyltransferase [Pseudomonadales bacterium]|nr:glycosyltransferase [Pseudomonadales bacterium]
MAIVILLYLITGAAVFFAFNLDAKPLNEELLQWRTAVFIMLAPITLKFVVQLIAAALHVFKQRHYRSQGLLERTPRVSVIVPAWNEEVGIISTLQSVIDTRYGNLELVVVNDGSTDSTHTLISDFIARHDALVFDAQKANIVYLNLVNGGKANAMNQALQQVSGEFIITLDADSYMDPQAIVNLLKQFDGDDQIGAVAGNVIVGNRTKPIALLQQLEYVYGFFFKRADAMFNSVYVIGGAAAAYRKSVLDIVGNFDHGIITEDIEMSMRILAHGYKTRYAPDAVVFTEGPSEWKGLGKQRLRWKFGRLLTFIKHKSMFFNVSKANAYLTCLLLPVAVFVEVVLLLQPLLMAFFYTYLLLSQNFMPLLVLIGSMSALVLLQISIDAKSHFHRNIVILAPIAWIMMYAIDWVEFKALCRSLKKLVRRQTLEWQVWQRVGLGNNKLPQA